MKNRCHVVLAALPLCLLAGCLSLFPDKRPPMSRYAVEVAAASQETAAAANGPLYAVGRVKASEAAAGRAMRTLRAATGRVGFLADGEFAQSPEAILRSALIRRLPALTGGATVCDGAMAPRGGSRVDVSAWIERFSLVESGGEWRFALEGFLYAEEGDGKMRAARMTLSRSLPDGKTPTAEATAATVAEMLSKDLDATLSTLVAPNR